MADMTDPEALADMRQGGRQGLITLHRRYAGRLKKFLMSPRHYHLSEPLADEISNETFFVFYKNIKQFKAECSVFNWLCSLAYNEMCRHWTKETRLKRQAPQPLPPPSELSEPFTLSLEAEQALCYERCLRPVLAEIRRGPLADCLTVLTLSLKGMSLQEIATIIGKSPNATAVFLSHCRKKLRQHPALKRCWEDC